MFCKQNAWLAEVPDEWVPSPHALTGLKDPAPQAPPHSRVRGDEIFMFVSGLGWALTHFGQKASVTFAQEKEAIIANVIEAAQCFGEYWELV